MHNRQESAKHYEEAKTYFPGGVNSPVRAFRSVEGTPLFIVKGDGCNIWDADGHEYIDFCGSWGPLILGHNHAGVRERVIATIGNGTSFGAPTLQENELASLIIKNHRFIEKLRFVSSGTEAVMSAIRLARGFTGRSKILKFEGCFHGHVDSLLVKAGSGLVTFGQSTSAGIPPAFAAETLVIPLNDNTALQRMFAEIGEELACVIIEPIPANNGLLLQDETFLKELRSLCTKYGALLCFDEVISGFRIGFEGASGHYDIKPDIITFGKIIGGGFPVGAYGASAEIMSHVSPDGPVYQAGTLSGNPVAMSAGVAQLTEVMKPGFYKDLAEKTIRFTGKIRSHIEQKKYPCKIIEIGSIFWIAFSEKNIKAAHDIDADSMEHFKKLHYYLLENGVYFGPSGYEVGFVSAAHDDEVLAKAADVICAGLDVVYKL
jgi:glutamate-1-semialdehyde 2,1-aminomutase